MSSLSDVWCANILFFLCTFLMCSLKHQSFHFDKVECVDFAAIVACVFDVIGKKLVSSKVREILLCFWALDLTNKKTYLPWFHITEDGISTLTIVQPESLGVTLDYSLFLLFIALQHFLSDPASNMSRRWPVFIPSTTTSWSECHHLSPQSWNRLLTSLSLVV